MNVDNSKTLCNQKLCKHFLKDPTQLKGQFYN